MNMSDYKMGDEMHGRIEVVIDSTLKDILWMMRCCTHLTAASQCSRRAPAHARAHARTHAGSPAQRMEVEGLT